ncbi:MAG: hypothetical protein GVY16_12500 [Planctomycetes bacterium]|jgi:hypothetical protein|nr:hypothetical protein [Planctomycetota bacterium]
MSQRSGETWRFTVSSPRAQRVFLVQRCDEGVSRWIEMTPESFGQFAVDTRLAPGHHRFHYFEVENGAFLNCGTDGLFAERTSPPDPTVLVAPLEVAMSA